ncbi:MAG: hypothetical protein QXV32_03540 [Conexivisphaerales archaeon]
MQTGIAAFLIVLMIFLISLRIKRGKYRQTTWISIFTSGMKKSSEIDERNKEDSRLEKLN